MAPITIAETGGSPSRSRLDWHEVVAGAALGALTLAASGLLLFTALAGARKALPEESVPQRIAIPARPASEQPTAQTAQRLVRIDAPRPGPVLIVVGSEEDAAAMRKALVAEANIRAGLGEPPRPAWIAVARSDEELAQLVLTVASQPEAGSVNVVDLRLAGATPAVPVP